MKYKILLGLWALLAVILMIGCQPETVEKPPFEPLLQQTNLAKEQGLAEALSAFTGDNLQTADGRTASSALHFGTLDYSEIIKTVASEDQPLPNYTIRLIPPDSVRNTIEYLVMVGEADGYWGYLMQYEADPAHWLTLFDRQHFTGHLRLLDFQRNVIADNLFEDGQDVGSVEITPQKTNGRLEISIPSRCNCVVERVWQHCDVAYGQQVPCAVSNLICDCVDGNSALQGEGDGSSDGGDWNTFPPGQPIYNGGGTSGGLDDSNNGGTRPPGDGISPGDVTSTISVTVDEEVRTILEDDEFMIFIQDEELAPCVGSIEEIITRNPDPLKQWYELFQAIVNRILLKRIICPDLAPMNPDVLHAMLDGGGMIPAIGPAVDGIHTIIYIAEGEYVNAGLTGVAIIPVFGAAGTVVKYLIKRIDLASPASKVLGDIFKSSSLGEKLGVMRQLVNFPKEALDRLAKAWQDNPQLLRDMLKSPRLLKSWKFLSGTIDKLRKKLPIKYDLDGTGVYKTVGGHHPAAKKAFEADAAYQWRDAFSVSKNKLEEIGDIGIHNTITGNQNRLYTAWKQANPSKKLGIDELADIEIKAMVEAGIPEGVARGWVVKALEGLMTKGITQITHIPWNGLN